MRNVSVAVVALLAVVSLTACNPAVKPGPAKPAATAKPPLAIPAAFKDDREKLAFAANAVFAGYHTEAAPLLEQLMKSHPSAEASRELGTAKYNLGDLDGAISAWQKARDMNPKLAGEMWNNVGNALRDEKKYGEAESAYRKALTVEPTRWNAAVNLATMLDGQGKLKDAVAVLEEAAPANKGMQPLQDVLEAYRARLQASSAHR